MTGILDRIRNATPESIARAGSSFDDAPAAVYRPRVAREMIRDVPGATDLRDAMPPSIPSAFAGQVTVDPDLQRRDTREFQDQQGLPSEAQRSYIESLLADIRTLDEAVWTDAMRYTCRMSENRAWDRSKGGNVSRWIDSLKAKRAEIRNQPKPEPVAKTNAWSDWRELAARLAAVGGTRGTRFAVDTEKGAVNQIAFWRISPSRDGSKYYLNQVIGGQGAVKVRMSPEAMIAIAEKIIAAGPVEAMIRYGLELGECGHCGRELTNDVSRGKGIGPHCEKHMGGWH